jgi:hypothetical protein
MLGTKKPAMRKERIASHLFPGHYTSRAVKKGVAVALPRHRVLVSFARKMYSPTTSFPRRRESGSQALGIAPVAHWIPAPRLRGDKLRGNDGGLEMAPYSQ